ncbi:hypothetical protein L1049_013783 [Liquidambar formosana]|uniref:Uncharacterized protein n=1 Tax=Liquidambar formosana TaxID=63359 RepID=A0AAP0RLY9_LIQFO
MNEIVLHPRASCINPGVILGVKKWTFYQILPIGPLPSVLNQFQFPTLLIAENLSLMEGLIPFIYRVIVRYRTGGQPSMAESWFTEQSSAPYMRLAGDSGRYERPDTQPFLPAECVSSSSSVMGPPSSSQLIASEGTQFPLCLSTSRHALS